VRNFLGDDDVFDPGTVSILMAAFDSAWQSIKNSGAQLSEKQSELVRATLAKYIIEQARQGEFDEVRLRDGAVLHLAKSNLKYPPTSSRPWPTDPFYPGATTKRPLTWLSCQRSGLVGAGRSGRYTASLFRRQSAHCQLKTPRFFFQSDPA
jgi:hypothetical protein